MTGSFLIHSAVSRLRILVIVAVFVAVNANIITDLYQAPSIATADSVQFFYLEAPFPYNCPKYIV